MHTKFMIAALSWTQVQIDHASSAVPVQVGTDKLCRGGQFCTTALHCTRHTFSHFNSLPRMRAALWMCRVPNRVL